MSMQSLYQQKRMSAADAVRVVRNGDTIIVPTAVGARGLEAVSGTGVVVSDDPLAQAEQVVAMLDDDDAWRRAATDVRRAGARVTARAAREGWGRVLAAVGAPGAEPTISRRP